MSTKSQAACRTVLLGYGIPRDLIDIKWRSSAVMTIRHIVSNYQVDVPTQRDLKYAETMRARIDPHFVYVAECQSICGTKSVLKVGITRHVRAREQSREKNPLVQWSPLESFECASKCVAEIVECSVLASAAKRGLWMGHEFIANCKWSKQFAARFASRVRDTQSIGNSLARSLVAATSFIDNEDTDGN